MRALKSILVFFLASLLFPAFIVFGRPLFSAWLLEYGFFQGDFVNGWIAIIEGLMWLAYVAAAFFYTLLLRADRKGRPFYLACSVIGVFVAALIAVFAPKIMFGAMAFGLNVYFLLALVIYFSFALRLFFYDLSYVGLPDPEPTDSSS